MSSPFVADSGKAQEPCGSVWVMPKRTETEDRRKQHSEEREVRARRLRKTARELDVTSSDWATASRLSYSTVRTFLRGKKIPRDATLAKLEAGLVEAQQALVREDDFQEWVRKGLQELGVSQKALAEASYLEASHVSALVRGRVRPSAEAAHALKEGFDRIRSGEASAGKKRGRVKRGERPVDTVLGLKLGRQQMFLPPSWFKERRKRAGVTYGAWGRAWGRAIPRECYNEGGCYATKEEVAALEAALEEAAARGSKESIGEWLTAILGEVGVPTSALAKHLDVSPNLISHWKRGITPVTSELRGRIEDAIEDLLQDRLERYKKLRL